MNDLNNNLNDTLDDNVDDNVDDMLDDNVDDNVDDMLDDNVDDTLDDVNSLGEEEIDDETRNIVFSTKLKNVDFLYNTKTKKKGQSSQPVKPSQPSQPVKHVKLLDLKPKRHFNPRLPSYTEMLKNKCKPKSKTIDLSNKSMFPSL